MPDVIKQSKFTLSLLDQDQIWIDGQGNRHDVAEMSVRYKANVIAFLERRAKLLEFHYSCGEALWFGSLDGGEMAMASLEDSMFEAQDERLKDPVAWLRSTRLVARLIADVNAGLGGEDD
jgi:hypothetical protein